MKSQAVKLTFGFASYLLLKTKYLSLVQKYCEVLSTRYGCLFSEPLYVCRGSLTRSAPFHVNYLKYIM